MEKSKKLLWILLFLVSGIIYYLVSEGARLSQNDISSEFIQEKVFVKRVIDGDSLELTDSRKVRLLGINSPERGRFLSNDSIAFSKILENESILLKYKEKDRYNRTLGYVYLNETNINQELVARGLAHLYYYEKDEYYERIKKAEEKARTENKGIWQKSTNFGCLTLVELKYYEDGKRCTNRERLVLKNECGELSVLIKDDATRKISEKIPRGIFSKNFSCRFNDDGDSLFVWDDSGLLVFYRYP